MSPVADDDVTPTVEDVIAEAMTNREVWVSTFNEDGDEDVACGVIDADDRLRLAAAVVAAVRAMTVEQLAQLIGGMTETGTFSRVSDGVPVATRLRVVGPWQVES